MKMSMTMTKKNIVLQNSVLWITKVHRRDCFVHQQNHKLLTVKDRRRSIEKCRQLNKFSEKRREKVEKGLRSARLLDEVRHRSDHFCIDYVWSNGVISVLHHENVSPFFLSLVTLFLNSISPNWKEKWRFPTFPFSSIELGDRFDHITIDLND